eukprot:9499668-Pyramimonas_sp.AAC.2
MPHVRLRIPEGGRSDCNATTSRSPFQVVVRVWTPGAVLDSGVVSTAPGTFQYNPSAAPTISSVTPSALQPNASAPLTVTWAMAAGAEVPNATAVAVTVGGAPCTDGANNAASDTEFTYVCTAAGFPAGDFPVVLTVPAAGASAPATVSVPLTLEGAEPAAGSTAGGQALMIRGSGFAAAPEENIVAVGAAACDVVEVGPDTLVCTTTAHPEGVVEITVRTSYMSEAQ